MKLVFFGILVVENFLQLFALGVGFLTVRVVLILFLLAVPVEPFVFLFRLLLCLLLAISFLLGI